MCFFCSFLSAFALSGRIRHVVRPFWHVWHMRSVGCVEACVLGVRPTGAAGWHFSFAIVPGEGGRGGVSPVNKGVWGGSFFAQAAAPREGAVIKDLRLFVCISMR